MTTKNSPLSALRAQSKRIAEEIKKAERGERIDARFAEKIAKARHEGKSFKVGVVMDDKLIQLTMTWDQIKDTTEPALAEYILDLMRETRSCAGEA